MAERTTRRRRHRGAGLVEYALGLSLILGASMGAISSFEQESADALEERGGSIGAPDLDEGAAATTATTGPPPPADGSTTTTAPPTPPASTVASAESTSSSNENKWSATVVIRVTAEGGQPVHRARLTASWQQNPGGGVTNVSCDTQPNGTCTFTLRNLGTYGSSSHVASVNFTLLSVTPSGGATTNPNLTVTVFEP